MKREKASGTKKVSDSLSSPVTVLLRDGVIKKYLIPLIIYWFLMMALMLVTIFISREARKSVGALGRTSEVYVCEDSGKYYYRTRGEGWQKDAAHEISYSQYEFINRCWFYRSLILGIGTIPFIFSLFTMKRLISYLGKRRDLYPF